MSGARGRVTPHAVIFCTSPQAYLGLGKEIVWESTSSAGYGKFRIMEVRTKTSSYSSLVTQAYTPLHSGGTCHSWKGYITVLLVDIFLYFWRIYTCTSGAFLPLLLMLTYIRVPVSLVDIWIADYRMCTCNSGKYLPVLVMDIHLYIWWMSVSAYDGYIHVHISSWYEYLPVILKESTSISGTDGCLYICWASTCTSAGYLPVFMMDIYMY